MIPISRPQVLLLGIRWRNYLKMVCENNMIFRCYDYFYKLWRLAILGIFVPYFTTLNLADLMMTLLTFLVIYRGFLPKKLDKSFYWSFGKIPADGLLPLSRIKDHILIKNNSFDMLWTVLEWEKNYEKINYLSSGCYKSTNVQPVNYLEGKGQNHMHFIKIYR